MRRVFLYVCVLLLVLVFCAGGVYAADPSDVPDVIPSRGRGGISFLTCHLLADADGSGTVDYFDFVIFVGAYGACSGECPAPWRCYDPLADFNQDGCVNERDLGILQAQWGASCDDIIGQ